MAYSICLRFQYIFFNPIALTSHNGQNSMEFWLLSVVDLILSGKCAVPFPVPKKNQVPVNLVP